MKVMLDRLQSLLIGASRTFALNIPKLPSPLVEAVTLGYLLFRNADTIEDAYLWPKEERIRELDRFIAVLNRPDDPDLAQAFAERYTREELIENPNYVELLRQTPFLIEQLHALPPSYAQVIVEHVTRTAEGMQSWIARLDSTNTLSFSRLKQLDDYCYTVAGIVGEMLTTLFALYSPHIEEGQVLYLRTLEIGYAAGLQLTNIIKDSFRDHTEGRYYIPPQYLPLGPEDTSDRVIPILVYAYRHLVQGIEYVLGVPPEESGIRKFCLIPVVLAAATLDRLLQNRADLYSGADVKINRAKVFELLNEVDQVACDDTLIQQLWNQLTTPIASTSRRLVPAPVPVDCS
jgi:farnesyl-diphosphate farnesyltransferase